MMMKIIIISIGKEQLFPAGKVTIKKMIIHNVPEKNIKLSTFIMKKSTFYYHQSFDLN